MTEKNNELAKQGEVTADVISKYLTSAGLAQNLTEAERMEFSEICLVYGLNPFKREIHASKYGNGAVSIVVGYETYIKRAERSGYLDGWEIATEGSVDWSNPRKSALKAIITIYRKDRKYPFKHEVYFAEYAQFKKDGGLNKFWHEKPVTMIKKVAMSQGFRLCFSDELGGMPYTQEEMPMVEDTTYTEVKDDKKQPAQPASPPPLPALTKEVLIRDALVALEACTTSEEVAAVWKSYPELKQEPEFIAKTKERGEELKEKEKSLVSTDHKAEVAIEAIQHLETPDDILEFTANETRKTVLEAAQKAIDSKNGEED